EVPDAVEAARLVISRGGSAQEGERSAVVVAGDHLRELGILDPVTGARVERLRPGQAVVARDGDVRVSVIVHVADVQRVARACRRRRISAWPAGLCTADGADIPRQAVVVADD